MMPRVQKPSSSDMANRESSRSYKVGVRSCLGCHRRKVRCDRGVPCKNCSRYGFTCVYPTKDSDEQKNLTEQHMSDRLERLETLLSHLCETRVSAAAGGGSENQVQNGVNPSSTQCHRKTWELLLHDGKIVQYVNNSNIKDLLQDEERMKTRRPSELEAAPPQLQKNISVQTSPSQSGPFSDAASNVLEFYPDPQVALQLWAVYVKYVDPVVKILHIPTTQSAVIATILDPKSAGASMVALTFAIYFAAITALSHNDEYIELPLEKSVLLKHYKTSLDRLLMVTDVMNRPEMTALQALAIYVTCLRVHETGRSVWVLNGLAIRLAQSIGLHRDGACLQLSPFDTEMRLRLWWHLCVLDSRAPEDQGFELTVDIMNRELRLPLNVNDSQICANMTQLPTESEGWTEMSFFLIQTESCRLLNPVLGTREQRSADALPDITAKRKMIQERTQDVLTKYGISSDVPSGLPRTALQHFTTACKKMEFMLQLREEISMHKQKGSQGDSVDAIKPSFNLACDGLESNYMLLKGGLSSGFKWLFTTYTQWYALAYVLRCLCSSPRGPETERAWTLVEEVFPREMSFDDHLAGTHDDYGHGSIWRCLSLLRSQALSLRHAQLSAGGVQSSGERCTFQGFRPGGAPQDIESLPDFKPINDQSFIADSSQNILSSLDFSMPEIPFLPDWDAVINGCLNDDDNSGVL